MKSDLPCVILSQSDFEELAVLIGAAKTNIESLRESPSKKRAMTQLSKAWDILCKRDDLKEDE